MTSKHIEDLERALKDAVGLLDDIFYGNQLYDTSTSEEQESRDELIEDHARIRNTSRRLLGQE